MSRKKNKQGFETRAIHAGQEPDPTTGAIMTPIYTSSTYVQESPGVHKGYDYSRSTNPTRRALEACIADLEGSNFGYAFASGMSASATVLEILSSGDHVIAMDDLYGGTYRLFENVRKRSAGLDFTFCDLSDVKALDNTFCSPFVQNPLEFGFDIVVHSATKYLNGHSDLIGGVVVCSDDKTELAEQLLYLQNAVGSIMNPFDSFLLLRSLKTLPVRMERHCSNAIQIANFLESHNSIQRVIYPGLESHPQHEIAKEQMNGFGGMISVEIKGGLEGAKKFLERTEIFSLAESLGGVESLIEHPAIMTHASIPPEVREEIGISDGLVRLSVGIEALEDLTDDLEKALA
jgi:cystathionine gamma-lyase